MIEDGAWQRVLTSAINTTTALPALTLRNPAWDPDRPNDAQPFIHLWQNDGVHLLVPRHFDVGMHWISGSTPTPPLHPALPSRQDLPPLALAPGCGPRNQLQEDAVEWLARPQDGRLMLRAGAGKTNCALMAAARSLIRPVLIVTHEQGTMEQWRDRIAGFTTTPKNDVGVVQGDRHDFEGRTITVAMMHTLALRESRSPGAWVDLQRWMRGGVVVYDELDVYAPTKMQKALTLFGCTRWGLTATHRPDGLQPVLDLHVGRREFYRTGYDVEPTVISCRVAVPAYLNRYRAMTNFLTQLEEHDETYRACLFKLAMESAAAKRKTLVLLQRVAAIEDLTGMLIANGVSAGAVHGGITGARRLEILRTAQVVVANRSIAGRALDVPDIETVIVSPTSNPALIEQVAGRALRVHANKKSPLVIIVWPWVALPNGKHDMSGCLGISFGMAARSMLALRRCGFTNMRHVAR